MEPFIRRFAYIVFCIFSAKELLRHRQKVIKLADQSENGWRTVAEYETNPIASDSEDEKRIYRAEARASRKSRFDRGGRRGRWRGHPYRRGFRRAVDSNQGDGTQMVSQQNKRPGLCFSCSMPGHWKFECPSLKAAANSNNKISSLYSLSVLEKTRTNQNACNENQEGNTCILKSIHCDDSLEEQCSVSIAGRLEKFYEKWKAVTDDLYILKVVKEGYRLPLKESPPHVVLNNNKSARDNMSFVQEEVDRLEKSGVVTHVEEVPNVVNPLTVAYSRKGKPRLVLDCRHINQFMHTFKYKYEDIKVAEDMFEPGSFLFTYDLKSAYHSICINSSSRTLLGFSITVGGKVRYYVFNCLPFGLSTAGHIFSKVLRVVVQYWRANGHKIIMFLDDGIGGSKMYEKALLTSNIARETLISLGFLLADEKCHWNPEQKVTWLGHCLDMIAGKLFITEERIKRLEAAIEALLSQIDHDQYSLVQVRALASVIGQVISLQNVVGKKVRLMTRQMYRCVLSRASWNAPVIVTEEARSELQFWKENARNLNDSGKSLDRKTFYEVSLFADASSKGYGGYIEVNENSLEEGNENRKSEEGTCRPPDEGMVKGTGLPLEVGADVFPEEGRTLESDNSKQKSNSQLMIADAFVNLADLDLPNGEKVDCGKRLELPIGSFQSVNVNVSKARLHKRKCEYKGFHGVIFGDWDDVEKVRSSTWRETETVRRLINSNIELLQHRNIKVFTDNKNVTSVLQIGSTKNDLQCIACDVNDVCERHGIKMSLEWIPRDQNQNADDLSRYGDCDDWSVSDHVFSELNLKWGPHTIDRFACTYNTKCRRFNSRFWVPGTEAVNSLHQNWSGEINWIVPPPVHILKCLRKIELEKASGTIVIPVWKSAPYWPELFASDGTIKRFITDFVLLPTDNVIQKGRGNNGIFGKPLSLRMLALRVRF